jgi:phosphoglycolate phosphatase
VTVRLAVFDCDGTLVDGQGDICAAMEAAFTAAGLAPPPRPAIRATVGMSLPEAVRRLRPAGRRAEHAALCDHYREAFRARRRDGLVAEPLFEGIIGVLDDLLAAGWLLGVATGKSERGLRHCLASHGLEGHFVTLQTADHHPSKPHPAMLEAALAEAGAERSASVMIGDTAFDIAMAAAIGVPAIGVGWGYHRPAELYAAGARAVAEDAAALLELLALPVAGGR